MKKYTIIYVNSLGVGVMKQIECLEGGLINHLETIGIEPSQLWAVLEGHPKAIGTDWSKL